METITVDGMDEHDFRYGIEDMLRLDRVDEALDKLRDLLRPYAGAGGVLPARFLEVTAGQVEFAGWNRLADRLPNHDRPSHPISAIGVVLADARALGGPGPAGGRLAPFIKTYYFSDDAYPFTEATREDLLDGYTREGFGWQSDYQATDATLSIKGIDDLYGAIIELEDRLLESASPSLEEIRAGTVGACFLATLIHKALRDTIRRNGLPRPLCVLAACDGVYPFFDAPVAGCDECVPEPGAEEVWPNELEGAAPVDGEQAGSGEGSLLNIAMPRAAKQPVLVLAEEDAAEAARFTELAEASRLAPHDEHRGFDHAAMFTVKAPGKPLVSAETHEPGYHADFPVEHEIEAAAPPSVPSYEAPPSAEYPEPVAHVPTALQHEDDAPAPPLSPDYEAATTYFTYEPPEPVLAAPTGRSIRARFTDADGEPIKPRRDFSVTFAEWLRPIIARLRAVVTRRRSEDEPQDW